MTSHSGERLLRSSTEPHKYMRSTRGFRELSNSKGYRPLAMSKSGCRLPQAALVAVRALSLPVTLIVCTKDIRPQQMPCG